MFRLLKCQWQVELERNPIAEKKLLEPSVFTFFLGLVYEYVTTTILYYNIKKCIETRPFQTSFCNMAAVITESMQQPWQDGFHKKKH